MKILNQVSIQLQFGLYATIIALRMGNIMYYVVSTTNFLMSN